MKPRKRDGDRDDARRDERRDERRFERRRRKREHRRDERRFERDRDRAHREPRPDERRADPRRPPERRDEPPRHEGGDDIDQHRPPSRRAKLILFAVGIIGVIVLLLFVLWLHHHHAAADERDRQAREHDLEQGPRITVSAARQAPPVRQISLPGEVRPWRVAVVYARVSGYLDELFVDRGDRVTKDRVLGRVTTPETELQLAPLEANLRTKQVIANRLRPLVPKGLVSQQDLDAADADVQAAQSDTDRLRAFKGFETVRAPFDGIVTQRYVDVGALMPAPTGSTQTAQPLVDISDVSTVRVVVYVGQRDATGIHVGDRLSIVRDDDPTHPIVGQVSRIPVDLDLRTRTMWVEADVPNPTGQLYPGSFVTVTLDVPAPAGVLIPSDSIALVAGKASVAIVKDNVVHFVPVDVTDDDGRSARVVKGVQVGELIANRISDELHDGGRVRAQAGKTAQTPANAGGIGGASGSGSNGSASGSGGGS
jgi:membrane fusion protein, multidrug efflux system